MAHRHINYGLVKDHLHVTKIVCQQHVLVYCVNHNKDKFQLNIINKCFKNLINNNTNI